MVAKNKATKSNVVLKESGKFAHIYIKNAIFYYAKVARPVDKYKGKAGEQEYSVTLFVDEATKNDLEALPVNKTFAEVDVDKIKKGPNRGNVKYSSEDYEGCEGLFGFTVNKPFISKSGKKQFVTVIDSTGEGIDKGSVGNGSKGTLKAMTWKNEDEEYNLRIDLLMITDLVEYTADGTIEDSELGVSYSTSNKSTESDDDNASDLELDDDTPPFDENEDESEDY